ncbi:spore germination lipoprotein GerD [Virgibacillus sp. YIM 98842]|jgi:spore germination protein D|uniref:spore germination lipoprotein GerD n=1 Tax=Virgibacillus sp. YIM 98842 TaxID=2663533 RepID=UPI0013DADF61|nr:spore germination lipoprotein GerD [Virgibacillus sp. YIM 98842]
MIRSLLISITVLSVLFFSGCGGGNAAQEDQDYEQTKKMVVDILQTEDGKKALKEILGDGELKQELVIESEEVKDSINQTLASDTGAQMWAKLFEDPEFVKSYAESMNEEQQKMMKNLMSDSEYQQQMLDLMQNPEIEEQMLNVLKSQQFRSHLEETIQQTLETPVFQAKIQEILLKAAEKQGQQQEGEGSGSEGGESNGSGGSGGGGGGDDSGSGGGS